MSATPSEGLTSAEAAERRRALGEPQADRTSIPLRAIIRRNVFTLINLITLGFLVLILISGAWKDALFAVVIVINSCIGIVQEVRAKRMLDRLALLIAPRATVRRDHTTIEILADEVVPDDIVELQPGDQVVADGEIVEARGLAIDESILTGESDQVSRRPGDTIYSGSYCAAGRGRPGRVALLVAVEVVGRAARRHHHRVGRARGAGGRCLGQDGHRFSGTTRPRARGRYRPRATGDP